MFERFTDRARKIVVLAQEEARMLEHNYIGSEHVLLGLLHEGEGVGPRVLVEMGVELEACRARVLEVIGQGRDSTAGHIPFTPRAKKIMELALREALQLGHSYIGTEHILLGLIREGEGLGCQVLEHLYGDRFELPQIRQNVLAFLVGEGLIDEANQAEDGELLTPNEKEVLELCRDLAHAIAKAIPEGPSHAHDWNELAASIHHIQYAFMAQAAARKYPAEYRLLGKSI